MANRNSYPGLTGVALRGFFAEVKRQVIKTGVTTIQLRPNGRVSPEHLMGWAKKNGFVSENIPNVGIRIGKSH